MTSVTSDDELFYNECLPKTRPQVREQSMWTFSRFFCVPFVAAMIGAHPAISQDAPAPESPSLKYAAQTGQWVLQVVGPKGEPVPHAQVDLRFAPKDIAWKILRGETLRKHRYGLSLQADQEGVLALEMPEASLAFLSAGIEAQGYGLFWARWEIKTKSEKLPAEYVAELDAGQSFGGVVVDPSGKPIPNASVHPSIEYKKRSSDLGQLGSGKSFTTDEQGRWSVHVVPAGESSLQVAISHPDFKKSQQSLSFKEYGLLDGQQPSATIALERGLALEGHVATEVGDPVSGAVVRARVSNRTLEAMTDATGHYRLTNLEEGSTDLVVVAKNYAPDLRTISVTEQTPAVDFALQPGAKLRVVVRDADGNPVHKARVFFQDWRGGSHDDELDKVHCYTDEQGEWIWENAPRDPIRVDICPPNAMQLVDQFLHAGKVNEFTSVPLLTIRGLVVDHDSGEKIESFRVVPGFLWPHREAPFWSNRDAFGSTDGLFAFEESRVDGRLVLRIEADGYAPYTSRAIEWNEGRVGLTAKLKKASSTIVRIRQPDGSPVSGAQVALGIKGSQIHFKDGEFGRSTYAEYLTSDAEGQCTLQPQLEALLLFVTHDAGYGEALFDPAEQGSESPFDITLVPWARVEGKVLEGAQPAAGKPVLLRPLGSYPRPDLPSAHHDYRAVADSQGLFVFERVIPGEFSVGKEIIVFKSRTGSTHMTSHGQTHAVAAGATQQVTLGGEGHRIIGQLALPSTYEGSLDWEFSSIEIHPDVNPPTVPYPAELTEQQRRVWFQSWLKGAEGQTWETKYEQYRQARSQRFCSGVERDGTFELHDIPPGRFEMQIKLAKPGRNAWGNDLLAQLQTKFVVPAAAEPFQTVDLGALMMELTDQ